MASGESEIIDIKTGKDYSQYLPDTKDCIDIHSNFSNIIVSESFLPVDNEEGFSAPATNMHIIGVRHRGTVIKGEVKYQQRKWQALCDSRTPLMSMGLAGDNDASMRWKKENVIGPLSFIGVHFSPFFLKKNCS